MSTEQQQPQRPAFEMMAISAKGGFLSIMKDETVWNREAMFALQILRGSNTLQKCDPDSIKNAVVNIALCGTTLNPALNLAYLVPRDGKCCLDLSYRGLAQIAMDSGSVKHIAPRLVYTFDHFEFYEEDGDQHLLHKPSMIPPAEFTKGASEFWTFLLCGYVVTTLHDGSKLISQPLPKWKLEKASKTSKTTSDKTPWRTHPDEMCLKTLVKHAYKLLPQTDRMSNAVSIINEHEGIDITPGKGEGGSASATVMERFGYNGAGQPAKGEAGALPPKVSDGAASVADAGNSSPTGAVDIDQANICPVCMKFELGGACRNPNCEKYVAPPTE